MTRLTCPLILLAALLSAGLAATRDPANLVVHEWGTFTSVAGPDGVPVEWWTPGGAQDLPCFVHRLGIPKANWMGTVRMETPVVYFYSPQATAVDVTVRFRQGLISEWFPRAKLSPDRFERVFATPGASHVVEWSNVKVVPAPTAAYPEEAAPSHYYAARQTDAATLEVDGAREKFLFYRGVGRFTVPIAAVEGGDGRIHVRHGGADAIPAVVLFEHRAGKIGYRVHSGLSGGLVLDRPSLDGSHRQLARDLTAILTRHGLYEKEAQAMVEHVAGLVVRERHAPLLHRADTVRRPGAAARGQAAALAGVARVRRPAGNPHRRDARRRQRGDRRERRPGGTRVRPLPAHDRGPPLPRAA